MAWRTAFLANSGLFEACLSANSISLDILSNAILLISLEPNPS